MKGNTLYQPNFNDPRCQATAKRVIQWLETYIGAEPNKSLQSTILRSPHAFGDSKFGRYLKNYLLIKTNPSFQPGLYSQQYRVDQDRLNKLRSRVGLGPTELRFTRIEDRFAQQQAQIASGNFEYNETGGRAYNGLQNIPKELKQQMFALRGYQYDYDIECCAPTLLLQKAQQINPQGRSFDYIEFYIANKTIVRDELCIKHNLSNRQVKQILNGLFQGGIFNTYHTNKIYGYVNHNISKIISLKEDEFIQSLQKDIKRLWQVIKEDIKITLNCNPRRLTGTYKSSYYKILEGEVMMPIWRYLKRNKIEHFREHDGFRSMRFVVPYELEELVKRHTGYQVTFIWNKVEVSDSN
jgi:hypothetical protein